MADSSDQQATSSSSLPGNIIPVNSSQARATAAAIAAGEDYPVHPRADAITWLGADPLS